MAPMIVYLASAILCILSAHQSSWARVINEEDPIFDQEELAQLEQLYTNNDESIADDPNIGLLSGSGARSLSSSAYVSPNEDEYELNRFTQHRLLSKRSAPIPQHQPHPPMAPQAPRVPQVPQLPQIPPATSRSGAAAKLSGQTGRSGQSQPLPRASKPAQSAPQLGRGGGSLENKVTPSVGTTNRPEARDLNSASKVPLVPLGGDDDSDDQADQGDQTDDKTTNTNSTKRASSERGLLDFKLQLDEDERAQTTSLRSQPNVKQFRESQINNEIVSVSKHPNSWQQRQQQQQQQKQQTGPIRTSNQKEVTVVKKHKSVDIYKALLGSISIISILGVISDLTNSFLGEKGHEMLQLFVSKMVSVMVEFMVNLFSRDAGSSPSLRQGAGKFLSDMLSGGLFHQSATD